MGKKSQKNPGGVMAHWKSPFWDPEIAKEVFFLWDQVAGHEVNCHPTPRKPHISRILKERSSSAIVLVFFALSKSGQSESIPIENTWVFKPNGVQMRLLPFLCQWAWLVGAYGLSGRVGM
jgi:hypothetical protein